MAFIYTKNETTKDLLLSENFTMVHEKNINNNKTWIFEYNPSLCCFNIKNSNLEYEISDKFLMTF